MEIENPRILLQELVNSKFLCSFNNEIYNQILKDINETFPKMCKLMKNAEKNDLQDHFYASRLFTMKYMLQRFKRSLLIYLNQRLNSIQTAFWDFGSNLPEEYKLNISENELTYFQTYKSGIVEYGQKLAQSYGFDNFDLTKDIEPPNSLYIEVRVIKDCGEILTSEGETVKLTLDSFHLLKRVDVEHLILQGFLLPQTF